MSRRRWETLTIEPLASQALDRLVQLRERVDTAAQRRRRTLTEILRWTASLPDEVAAFFVNHYTYLPDKSDSEWLPSARARFDFELKAPLHHLVTVASGLSREQLEELIEAAYDLLLRTPTPAENGGEA